MTEADLVNRLEKLERDNRRFKRLALAALVLPIALVSIYATRPVPQKITAHEFDVVDSAGKVCAALRIERQLPSSARRLLQSKLGLTVTAPVPELWMGTSLTWRGQPRAANVDIDPTSFERKPALRIS